MKPVAIFRYSDTEGPGYFATYLDGRGIAWRIVKIDAGEAVPSDPKAFSGMVFMGGPMSVNDDLPWLPPMLNLIRAGAEADVPLLGHCLGGQLMAKAMGGVVSRNPVKEIGWGEISVADNALARRWFGYARPAFLSFHWHGETFTIPPRAQCVLSNAYCENQAFAIGKHLGMQCHVEMTPEMIASWCESGAHDIARSKSPAVQSVEEIRTDLERRLASLHRVADGVYEHWVTGLAA
jgi:GMP synthase-like glutamine amidotransferase